MCQGRGGGIFATTGIFGTLDGRGRFRRVGTTPTDQRGRWSPDGSALAYQADGAGNVDVKVGLDRVRVEHLDGTADRELPLPPDRPWTVVAWESATDVVVATRHRDGDPGGPGLLALARCDVVTDTCERTVSGPTGDAALPDGA